MYLCRQCAVVGAWVSRKVACNMREGLTPPPSHPPHPRGPPPLCWEGLCTPPGGSIHQDHWVFFTLFPKITQVCVKVNCYTILCKTDEVFTQSNVGVLTFYTMLCKNVNLYTGLCNDSISCICDKFYTNLCNFTQSCVSLH